MKLNFEQAFIQCLKDGVYPGPANINQRWRSDGKRVNKLNGQYTRERLALMYAFGVPYQRGRYIYDGISTYPQKRWEKTAGEVPDYPYLTHDWAPDSNPPQMGRRKHEIQDPDKPWELRRK